MKLTKKILSLVLAVALVLGSIAVAANAAAYDGLAYEGSKLTYTVAADKTEVKPGETVTISVYMTSNYYTGSAGGLFAIWNAGVFDALGTNYSIQNFGTTFTNKVVNPAKTAAYPSGYTPVENYVGVQIIHQLTAGVTAPAILDNELVYQFKFTVLETATPGAKVTFEIPAGAVKSDTLPGMKGMTYMGIGSSASNPTNTKAYAQTTDVSAASVTITVASNVEYCDYAALEAAVVKAPELAEEYYDAEEYKAWADAKAAGQALLDAEALEKTDANQKKIADAAALVESTLAALDARYLDLTKLNNAVDACDEVDPADADYYNADDYAAWQQALADAKAAQNDYNETMPATKQAEVDAIADDLTAAYAKLAPAYLDISPVQDAIADCGTLEYSEEYYDADEYEEWDIAIGDACAAQVNYNNLPDTQQNRDEIAEIAQALRTAYAELDPRFVDASAIANAITAYGTTDYAAEYYDADEYAAWKAALAAANDADFSEAADTQANRDAVAKIADDLKVAFEALDARYVDVTPIADAIADCVIEYPEEYYDATAWDNFEAAVKAATTVSEDYRTMADTQEYRDDVAEAAQAIRDAYAALVPQFVSYEKVEQALADFAQPEHPEFYYTTDSWANYEAALAAANDANTNRPQPLPAATEANQAAVDKYADDLAAAYKALAANDVCHIISVTPMQKYYSVGDVINFEVVCEGTDFSKIRIIHENGATNTYSRDHASVKSITVNEDGNEVWVIARKIYKDEYNEYAKAKMGKNWDNGMVTYALKTSAEMDYEVRSVKVTLDGNEVTTFATSQIPTITIVTGPDAKKVQLYDKTTTCTLTYSTPTSINDDGSKVWVITRRFSAKLYDFDVRVKSKTDVWYESDFDFAIDVTETVISQLPSTGNAEDAFLTAPTISSKRFLRGGVQTFGFVTDKNAKAVRIINENGTVFVTLRTPESADEASKTWIYKATYTDYEDYSYTVEALYGDTWIESAYGTIDFTVLY